MEFIEVSGEKHPVRWPIGPLRAFLAKCGFSTKLSELAEMQNMDMEQLTEFAYVGLKFGAKAADTSNPYTLDELGETIEMHEAAAVMEVFSRQFEKKAAQKAQSSDEAKEVKN